MINRCLWGCGLYIVVMHKCKRGLIILKHYLKKSKLISIIEPEYRTYFQRSLSPLRKISLILIVLFIIGLLGDNFLITNVIILFLSVLVISISLIQNSEYLEKIEINENRNTISVKTRTRDKVNDIQVYLIENIDIKIKKTEVIYPTYILEISHCKKRIIKQRTFGKWNTDYFIQILKRINEIKGKNTIIDYIR